MVNHCRWLCIISLGSLPLDGFGSGVPSLQLHPVFGVVSSRVPPGDTMSRFVGFGDKSWDNSKNFFQTQGFEFLFLSQRAQRAAFGGSISPKTPVLKLNRSLACKPPAAIASELTRVACASCAKSQLTGLRHRWSKGVVSGGLPMSWRAGFEIPPMSGNASSSLEFPDST